jgi:hypothetical protein
MYRLNEKKINIDAPFTAPDGTRYRNLQDPAVRAALGVVEVPDPVRKDERFYNITEDEAGNLTQEPKPVSQVLSMLWGQIKQYRDYLIQTGGAKVGTKWYHSDTHSKAQQMALVMLGSNIPASLQWKTMDGSFELMTPTLAQEIFAAQVAQEQAVFQKAEQHKAALAAMTDVDQMAAYDWKAGWPEVYEETP